MNKSVNLFNNPGRNPLYELTRTRNNPNDKQVIAYWNNKYSENAQYLDKKFVSEFPISTEACLWELTLSDFLKNSPNIELLEDKDFGRKNKSKPDFCFLVNNQRYFLEATIINPGEYPALNIELDEVLGSSCRIPREEYKEKICGAIDKKINAFNNGYKDIITDNDGYFIAISSSPIGIHLNPNDLLVEASCLFGLSERIYDPNTEMIYLAEEDAVKKKKSNSPLKTNYFKKDEFNFLSGVLFSRRLCIFYPKLEGLEHAIPDIESECIYFHNPIAKNQLPRQAFPFINQFESREDLENALISIL
ncbi:hypothetical protein [Legionella spiritensis]|uniref:Uncharacterized protein n=1 Tax=Legionella spiritensis TaxID=452 RepID=A0A0W0Z8C0_LEGSP|nr:hypothetical protein [Legionella spiritensis]KTD65376.1 hypothetical protein Lspi_0693 [Legionella spiritensis]SNV47187.1 Uncharacterised protein [Legionella spiritensis]